MKHTILLLLLPLIFCQLHIQSTVKISNTMIPALEADDRFGTSLAVIPDLDLDGNDELLVGTVNDDDQGLNQGALYILFLTSTGSIKSYVKVSSSSPNFFDELSPGDSFGSAVSVFDDLDGDSVPDIVVGAHLDDNDTPDSNRGAIYILFMMRNGTIKSFQKISGNDGGFVGELNDSDFFGRSVSVLPDLDLDGVPDLAVGAYRDDDGFNETDGNTGAVWILFMNDDGTVKGHQKISAVEGGFNGTLIRGDNFGFSVTAFPDLDGDGIPDLAVGSLKDDDGGVDRGAIWILFLTRNGTVRDFQKISSVEGGFNGELGDSDYFGGAVARLPDINGDGIDDLLVGADRTDDGGSDRGAIWILYLDYTGSVLSFKKISDTEGGFEGVLGDGNRFGGSVTFFTDLNQDGFPDLVIGMPLDDDGFSDSGAVYILFTNFTQPAAEDDSCASGCAVDEILNINGFSTLTLNNITITGAVFIAPGSGLTVQNTLTVQNLLSIAGFLTIEGDLKLGSDSEITLFPESGSIEIGGCAEFSGSLILDTIPEVDQVLLEYNCPDQPVGNFSNIFVNGDTCGVEPTYGPTQFSISFTPESCDTWPVESETNTLLFSLSILGMILL